MLCGDLTLVESCSRHHHMSGRIYNYDIISAMYGMPGMHDSLVLLAVELLVYSCCMLCRESQHDQDIPHQRPNHRIFNGVLYYSSALLNSR